MRQCHIMASQVALLATAHPPSCIVDVIAQDGPVSQACHSCRSIALQQMIGSGSADGLTKVTSTSQLNARNRCIADLEATGGWPMSSGHGGRDDLHREAQAKDECRSAVESSCPPRLKPLATRPPVVSPTAKAMGHPSKGGGPPALVLRASCCLSVCLLLSSTGKTSLPVPPQMGCTRAQPGCVGSGVQVK